MYRGGQLRDISEVSKVQPFSNSVIRPIHSFPEFQSLSCPWWVLQFSPRKPKVLVSQTLSDERKSRSKIVPLFTAVFKKVATFNIYFASRDGNRTHQNAFRSCDSNFVHKKIETERTKASTAKSNVHFFVLESRWLCRDFISSSIYSKRCSPARKSIVFRLTGAINHMT